MDAGRDNFLHWSFRGSHILVPGVRLDSFGGFLTASLLTIFLCWSERFATFALDRSWEPSFAGNSRWRVALWRTFLYWIATSFRLGYMLIAMSFHAGLVLVIVTALASAQFVIELFPPKPSKSQGRQHVSFSAVDEEPLLQQHLPAERPHAMVPFSRPRSKSKPDDIFIHPNLSNIARADAAALELGLSGETDRVRGNYYPQDKEATWQVGKGRDAARALLGADRSHFGIGGDSDVSDMESPA